MPIVSLASTDVLILVGGQGTRLRPVVGDRAKPMADVGGRPFLDLVIRHISAFGARRLILATGHRAESITGYYRQSRGPWQVLVSHEREPLGTAGAVKNAEDLLRSDPFLVMNGDSFCQGDWPAFLEFHLRKRASASIALARAEDSHDFGTVELNAEQQVVGFEEKKAQEERGFINAGVYLFGRHVLSLIPANVKYSLEYDFFPRLVGHGFYGFDAGGQVIDIGTPERYRNAMSVLGSAVLRPSEV